MNPMVKAITFTGVNQVAIKEYRLGDIGATEVLCETLYTFVSPGTELRVLSGQYSKPEDFPLIPGYSAVARVLKLGEEAKGFRVGDLVSGRNPQPIPGIKSMWGGQASMHVYTTTGEDRPVLLPDGADPMDYVVAEVSAISHRGIEAARPVAGETAVVIGQGMIGAFSAAWLTNSGCRVIACDIDEKRLAMARQRGVAETVNLSAPDAMDRLTILLHGGADIVVESSGVTAGVKAAYQLVRKKPQAYGKEYKVEPISFYQGNWARLVMQANYIEDVPINPHGFFPGEGVTILTPMDRGVEDRQKTVEAIRTGRLNAKHFIDAVLPFSDAASGYEKLQNHEAAAVLFTWK